MPRTTGGSPKPKAKASRERAGLTLLVDSSSLIYRAFFAVPDTVRAPDGTQVNAAHGFLEMLHDEEHRIFAPDIEVLGRAALLSGILCRLQGYEKDRLRALQDCVLFLQAQKLGVVVLTANVGDYDVLLQLIPTGRVLFYRSK